MKNFLSLLIIFGAVWSAAFGSTLDFNHFWTLEEISEYLHYLEHNFHDYGHIETYGTTWEGRTLQGFHIADYHDDHDHRRSGEGEKPVIFIEAGMRPREWMGVMSALYFLHEVVEHAYDFEQILEHIEFVVIPVANPDGYAFSHTAGNRQWNKNRRVNAGNAACRGVDVNANFGFAFLQLSEDRCSATFPGIDAFSEAESLNLRNLIAWGKYSGRVAAYISLQAHGTQIAVPSSHEIVGEGNHTAILELANRVASRINQQNPLRNYKVGIGADIREAEFGTSTDYIISQLSVPYVFSIFLPSGGPSGFDPPTSQILPVASETFVGLIEVAEHLLH